MKTRILGIFKSMLDSKENTTLVRFLLLILAVFTVTQTRAQQLNVRDLEKLRNDDLPMVYGQDGNEIGGHTYESKPLGIVFYSVSFDAKKKEFSIQGKALESDSTGLAGVTILQGRLKSGKMKIYSVLGVSNFPTSSQQNKLGSPSGEFDIHVELRKNCKIYFADPMHYLVEYDINKMKDQNVSTD